MRVKVSTVQRDAARRLVVIAREEGQPVDELLNAIANAQQASSRIDDVEFIEHETPPPGLPDVVTSYGFTEEQMRVEAERSRDS